MTARLTRRSLLGAAGVVGAAGLLDACSADAAPDTGVPAAEPLARTTSGLGVRSFVEHLGAHQAGIVTPAPEHAVVAAFDTTAGDVSELAQLLQDLADETDLLTSAIPFPEGNPLLPPPDNGILGMAPEPADLTITVAFGASLFDERFGLQDLRPRELTAMPRFPNDDPNLDRSHGDVLLQICGSTEETTIHALRRLMRVSRRSLTLRWVQSGFQQPNILGAGRASTRNLLGFKDGTANPDPSSPTTADSLVWVQPDDGEPTWAVGGTYQVVRIIRNRVEFWDRTALKTQELIIGRHKATGAPLGRLVETELPDFAADPDGTITPLTSHIRLANPRTAASQRNLILRRGFSYSSGFTSDGQLDQGLLFICFQRSLVDGFLTVQRRLDGEALEEYIRPVGGGFFFVPPGRARAGEPFAAGLLH